MMLIDIAITCLICFAIIVLDIADFAFAIRAKKYGMRVSFVILVVLAVLLTFMLIDIIIKGGIH